MSRFGSLAVAAVIALATTATPAFARANAVARYWNGFKEYWTHTFENQGAIVMLALGTGVVGIFIITRGKWKK